MFVRAIFLFYAVLASIVPSFGQGLSVDIPLKLQGSEDAVGAAPASPDVPLIPSHAPSSASDHVPSTGRSQTREEPQPDAAPQSRRILSADDVLEALRNHNALPLVSFARRVEQQQAGQIIDAALLKIGSAFVYEIKVIDGNGQVNVHHYNARTGAYIGRR
ncbi:PepSY domain-containing protein [Devosia sp. Naph2]|uniref:PepSY domain-containing protein n=1 Tax=Devosia polycyclovorans TaxID=3345148 RepID=UPI0035D06A36